MRATDQVLDLIDTVMNASLTTENQNSIPTSVPQPPKIKSPPLPATKVKNYLPQIKINRNYTELPVSESITQTVPITRVKRITHKTFNKAHHLATENNYLEKYGDTEDYQSSKPDKFLRKAINLFEYSESAVTIDAKPSPLPLPSPPPQQTKCPIEVTSDSDSSYYPKVKHHLDFTVSTDKSYQMDQYLDAYLSANKPKILTVTIIDFAVLGIDFANYLIRKFTYFASDLIKKISSNREKID